MKEVIIPNSVKEIENNAFAGCTALNLAIPDSVEKIGENAFENVPHIEYHGSATGAPGGAEAMN